MALLFDISAFFQRRHCLWESAFYNTSSAIFSAKQDHQRWISLGSDISLRSFKEECPLNCGVCPLKVFTIWQFDILMAIWIKSKVPNIFGLLVLWHLGSFTFRYFSLNIEKAPLVACGNLFLQDRLCCCLLLLCPTFSFFHTSENKKWVWLFLFFWLFYIFCVHSWIISL